MANWCRQRKFPAEVHELLTDRTSVNGLYHPVSGTSSWAVGTARCWEKSSRRSRTRPAGCIRVAQPRPRRRRRARTVRWHMTIRGITSLNSIARPDGQLYLGAAHLRGYKLDRSRRVLGLTHEERLRMGRDGVRPGSTTAHLPNGSDPVRQRREQQKKEAGPLEGDGVAIVRAAKTRRVRE